MWRARPSYIVESWYALSNQCVPGTSSKLFADFYNCTRDIVLAAPASIYSDESSMYRCCLQTKRRNPHTPRCYLYSLFLSHLPSSVVLSCYVCSCKKSVRAYFFQTWKETMKHENVRMSLASMADGSRERGRRTIFSTRCSSFVRGPRSNTRRGK